MIAPKLRAPTGACDCHMHVYEDRFLPVPTSLFKPPHAPLNDYLAVQSALGLSRAVLVQPNGYGFRQPPALEALAELGDARARDRHRASGRQRRGARAVHPRGRTRHPLPPAAGWRAALETLKPIAARIAAFGWHVQLQLDGRDLVRYEKALAKLPVPGLVIDHNGKFMEPVATDHPGFRALLRLLDGGNTWVKLSAPYETSTPHYDDVCLLARALVRGEPAAVRLGDQLAPSGPQPGA